MGCCFSIKLLIQFKNFLTCFSIASASNLPKAPLKWTINECIEEKNTYLPSLLVYQRCLGLPKSFYLSLITVWIPPFLITFPVGEGDGFEKFKKGDGSMVQGQVFLKRGGRGASTFPIKFFQGLLFSYLEITLPFAKLCYAFDEKNFFPATIIL